jgi:hypothetical protein
MCLVYLSHDAPFVAASVKPAVSLEGPGAGFFVLVLVRTIMLSITLVEIMPHGNSYVLEIIPARRVRFHAGVYIGVNVARPNQLQVPMIVCSFVSYFICPVFIALDTCVAIIAYSVIVV